MATTAARHPRSPRGLQRASRPVPGSRRGRQRTATPVRGPRAQRAPTCRGSSPEPQGTPRTSRGRPRMSRGRCVDVPRDMPGYRTRRPPTARATLRTAARAAGPPAPVRRRRPPRARTGARLTGSCGRVGGGHEGVAASAAGARAVSRSLNPSLGRSACRRVNPRPWRCRDFPASIPDARVHSRPSSRQTYLRQPLRRIRNSGESFGESAWRFRMPF